MEKFLFKHLYVCTAAVKSRFIARYGGNSAAAICKTEFDKNTGAMVSGSGFVDCDEGLDTASITLPGNQLKLLRRLKELKGFNKVYIKAGETKKVTFNLGYDELKIYSINQKYEVEDADVEIMVGSNPNLPLRAFIHTSYENII